MRDFREQGRGHRGHRHDGEGWEGRRRGGRMRRGDIRTALLAILVEEPGHGYDLIQRLEEKTDNAWRPSPGSVYPTLQLLEDEGLVRSGEHNAKRVYEITDAGREEATRRVEEAGGTPWELAGRSDSSVGEFRNAVRQLIMASKQVVTSGNQDQIEKMVEILKRARKEIYTMLAND
jgi:DNA-binding PadR family transcriptional regulator